MKNILFILILLSLLGCSVSHKTKTIPYHEGTESLFNPAMRPFYHGVASGDPGKENITIWTRVTPDKKLKSITGTWMISAEDDPDVPLQKGNWITGPERDYTVKVTITGLLPGSLYRYGFEWNGVSSGVGRTRTLPEDQPAQLKFAVVSCNNYEAGYYNAFARLAERSDIQAIIHLGDYIYEYQPGFYGDRKLDRKHIPPTEVIELNEYRTRYAQYRTDSDLQRVHQMHPFITIWDDHEISNNSFMDGAQNHQSGEGSYEARKQAARQAYYEWLPVALETGGCISKCPDVLHLIKLRVLNNQ